ncbi:MAG TPA: sigma-70 family RNA polymerase sigma factor [Pyrinomonadaceae bacterium]
MTNSSSSRKADFATLLQDLLDGRRSIDDFLTVIDIEKWLSIFCDRYDFTIFEGAYGPDDLFLESLEKVLKSAPKLKPENTPNECAFYGWLSTLVFHTFLDALRKLNKLKNNGQVRSDNPETLLNIHAPEVDYDGKYFLSRFLKFIERYAIAQRRATEYWLADYSYRETAEALNDEGLSDCCHVTVKNWVEAILKAFKEDLGELPPPKKPRRW